MTNLLGIHAQTELGKMQALEAGKKIRKLIESEGKPFKVGSAGWRLGPRSLMHK